MSSTLCACSWSSCRCWILCRRHQQMTPALAETAPDPEPELFTRKSYLASVLGSIPAPCIPQPQHALA